MMKIVITYLFKIHTIDMKPYLTRDTSQARPPLLCPFYTYVYAEPTE